MGEKRLSVTERFGRLENPLGKEEDRGAGQVGSEQRRHGTGGLPEVRQRLDKPGGNRDDEETLNDLEEPVPGEELDFDIAESKREGAIGRTNQRR